MQPGSQVGGCKLQAAPAVPGCRGGCASLPPAPTLMSSFSHLLSLKVQLPMEKVTAMEWPTKEAGTFWPAGEKSRERRGAGRVGQAVQPAGHGRTLQHAPGSPGQAPLPPIPLSAPCILTGGEGGGLAVLLLKGRQRRLGLRARLRVGRRHGAHRGLGSRGQGAQGALQGG